MVALDAPLEDNRSNVFTEGHLAECRRPQQERGGQKRTYLLVHQSVTAKLSGSVQFRATAKIRQKPAFFCPIPLFIGHFPQYTGRTFIVSFAPSSRTA
jgi:hypothetical protein